MVRGVMHLCVAPTREGPVEYMSRGGRTHNKGPGVVPMPQRREISFFFNFCLPRIVLCHTIGAHAVV